MNSTNVQDSFVNKTQDASRTSSVPEAELSGLLRNRRNELDHALAQLEQSFDSLHSLAGRFVSCLRDGGKILIAGNGGSAAEAQHIAAELVGRFQRERAPYPAIALSTDTSILTAIANDYGYEQVFARQILGLGQPGDLFLALSTSGNSINLVKAAIAASEAGLYTACMTGSTVNQLSRWTDINVHFSASSTPVIQELHLIAGHIVCELIETQLASLEQLAADD